MIESIVAILVEIGLISEDYKHRKGITNKEQKDGVKRSFQKYFLQPSILITIGSIAVLSISGFVFINYQRSNIYPKKTKKEISRISDRLEEWNEKFGNYPINLRELIGVNPIQKQWELDAWNRPYKYSVKQNQKGFLIISAGYDGEFGTEDDIKSK